MRPSTIQPSVPWRSTQRQVIVIGLFLACALALSPGSAQPLDAPGAGPTPATPMSAGEPGIEAQLVDKEKKAAKRAATVKVEARNVAITDPAAAGEKPQKGQAHFHYQVDSGPVVATTGAKLSFHELSPGPHVITVTLAGNDHKPVAPPVRLDVRVP